MLQIEYADVDIDQKKSDDTDSRRRPSELFGRGRGQRRPSELFGRGRGQRRPSELFGRGRGQRRPSELVAGRI